MLREAVQSFWEEPRAADPPARVWRDWLLVAVLIVSAVAEMIVRDDIGWRPVSFIVCVGLTFTLLWRRTHPLGMVAIAFGSLIVIDIVTYFGTDERVGLNTVAFVLILVYSLFRWGSGREAAIGFEIMVVALVTGMIVDFTSIGDLVGGSIVLLFPAVLGASIRYRGASRLREMDQVKLREREQLARELHDTVAHHVSAIAVQAQAGRAVADSRPGAALDALAVIEEEASRTLAEMRVMVAALREGEEADLAPQRGVADIERLGRVRANSPRVQVELIGDLDELRPSVEAAVYRLAQESITNALRHARHASQIDVRVAGEAECIRLTVRDDGDPAPFNSATVAGFGLVGMTERAKLLGGTLAAGPGPARGWTVDASLPRSGSVT